MKMHTITLQYYDSGWIGSGTIPVTRLSKFKSLKRHKYDYPYGGFETNEIGFQWRYELSWDWISGSDRTSIELFLNRLLYGRRVRIHYIDSTLEDVEVQLDSDDILEKNVEWLEKYPLDISLISTDLLDHENPDSGGGVSLS